MVHASQQEGAWPVRRLGDVRLALSAVGARICRKDPCACRLVRYGVLVDPRISAKAGRPDMKYAAYHHEHDATATMALRTVIVVIKPCVRCGIAAVYLAQPWTQHSML